MFFTLTMVMVTIALVMAVITTNLYAKKDSTKEAPRWAVRMAKKMIPEVHIPTDEKLHGLHSLDRKQDCNGRHSDVMSITDGEMDSLTSGQCCQCRTRPEFIHQLDLDRIEAEWKLVTKMSDRCFFWLFIVLSVTTQSVLFCHMVPEGPHPSAINNDDGG